MVRNTGKKIKAVFMGLAAVFCSAVFLVGCADAFVANSISVFEGDDVSVPTYASTDFRADEIVGFSSSTLAQVKILGVDFKSVPVNIYKDIKLCPGGNAFGVKLKTGGVIIVGINDIEGYNKNPARDSGLRIGDIIISINGKRILTADDVTKAINESDGNEISISYKRNGEEQSLTLQPLLDKTDGKYKTGIWVRDSTAGIGTVTFIDPQTGSFGGLGHGICDIDTGILLPIEHGDLYNVVISGINKGAVGTPGELRGFFLDDKKGTVNSNTECGVFGQVFEMPDELSEPIPIALRDEIKTGPAELICTTEENVKTSYDIEIQKIFDQSTNTKNFIVKVTDDRLIEKTGGIVQGMSGSPIIQNGKLIGAVTHVLVNDPKRGYGIFIENMLTAAQ